MLQHDLGAVDVRLERVHRLFDDQLDADGRGQMKDDVAAIDHLGQQRLVGHRVDDVRESRMVFQVRDVVDRAGREVVEDEHLVAVGQQPLGEMRSDEAGAAGNQRDHARTSRLSRLSHGGNDTSDITVGRTRVQRQRQQLARGARGDRTLVRPVRAQMPVVR